MNLVLTGFYFERACPSYFGSSAVQTDFDKLGTSLGGDVDSVDGVGARGTHDSAVRGGYGER